MPWSFQADTPIYTQLVARLQEQIVSGAYPPGSKLPSVRDLAADAGVNPNTVQRAFAELERLGLIYTQRTSGKFVTEDAAAADAFCAAVDSAAVYVNASTRFTDGGEFGLGCEMGISTQKLGARGPMGLAELTSYKYIIRGNGQVR